MEFLGMSAGGIIGGLAASAFEAAMQAVWVASLTILRVAFQIADEFSVFTVSTTEGPVAVLWPMILWLSGILALGLFFWQITVAVLRGGRGFIRVMSGPFQYGAALAVSVGLVAGFLAAADGVTKGILNYGLHVNTFSDALSVMGFNDAASDTVKAAVVGLTGLFGVIPAGLGFVVEMVFREAAVYLLVATLPLTAAGLLANVTSSWFWRAVRWLLAAIVLKPALALTLVIGIAISGEAQGLSGLIAGVAVLWIAVWVPLVLYRLFAFVDPNTEAGAAVRNAMSDAGIDSYGSDSAAGKAAHAAKQKFFGGGDDDEDGEDESERANTDRFDTSMDDGDLDAGTPNEDAGTPNETEGKHAGDDAEESDDGGIPDDEASHTDDSAASPDPTPADLAPDSDSESSTAGDDASLSPATVAAGEAERLSEAAPIVGDTSPEDSDDDGGSGPEIDRVIE